MLNSSFHLNHFGELKVQEVVVYSIGELGITAVRLVCYTNCWANRFTRA